MIFLLVWEARNGFFNEVMVKLGNRFCGLAVIDANLRQSMRARR
jgi:hypothetical protein